MYSRQIDGNEYTFGVSGKLIRNVLVMYDRQTNSYWSQLLGEAVEGPLQGTALEFMPSWMTTWEDWKTRHPETLALRKGYSGAYDPYGNYYNSGQAGVIGEAFSDDRLYTKEFVIGLELNREALAIPFSVLNKTPVTNHAFAGEDILIAFNVDTGTGAIFDRNLDGRVLTFDQEENLVLVDRETGTRWNGLTGEALEGELEGSRLDRLKSTAIFWFGWKDFFPNTKIFGEDG